MKIGELASAAKCTTDTIRFYEKAGLLPATERTGGNYRSYGPAHAERLRFIRNCRALDMNHEEIRMLLAVMDIPAVDCSAANTVLDAHIRHVDVRIEELSQLGRQLNDLRQQCQADQPLDTCGILRGLATMETEASSEQQTHLG